MTKYQLQAANKWSFDFANESPISGECSQYKWDSARLPDVPRFYHHTVTPANLQASANDECENICPLSHNIGSASLKSRQRVVVSSSSGSFSQTKITGECEGKNR
jgi:hypothetical protein